MIVFNNWTLTVTGLIARQYDNLSRRIDVEGDLPEGYTWQLLVQSGGNADTILLEPTEKGAGALLTADNLSRAGEYYIQLRGVLKADGVTRRHTNVVSAYIPESLTGLGTWPEVPTEFAQVEARILDLYQHPPIPGSNGYWLVWDTDKDEYVESQLALPEAAAGGTSDHSKLKNRDAAGQHPMSAITGLEKALEGKQAAGNYVTEESDPTVPEWAKQPQKPVYTAQEVGALPDTTHIPSTAAEVNAEPSGAVAQHNVSDAAHSDIRLLIQGLSERLSAVADSDDTTLDQLSEIVAYIKSNRELIAAITTDKVSVADIIDNLTTNVANKPLSAAQGVALKALIDALTEAMPEAYTLPIASSTQLGGVQPAAKTDTMTQAVGVDETGALFTEPGSGGGGGTETWRTVVDLEISEDDVARIDISVDGDGKPFSLKKFIVLFPNKWTAATAGYLRFNGTHVWIASLFQSAGYRMTKIIGDFSSGQLMFTAVYSTNTASSAAQIFASTNPNGQTAYNQIEGTALTSLSIYPQGTNTLVAGTKLKLIGVDA